MFVLEQIQATWHALPYGGPAIVAGLALAAISYPIGATRSRRDRIACGLLLCWFVVTAVTANTPVSNHWEWGAGRRPCQFTPWLPLPLNRWWEASSDALNIWYFAPAALAAMLLDGRRRLIAVAAVLSTPIACEFTQWLIPASARTCIAEDVANNWVGTAIGMVLGVLLRRCIPVSPRLRRLHRADGSGQDL